MEKIAGVEVKQAVVVVRPERVGAARTTRTEVATAANRDEEDNGETDAWVDEQRRELVERVPEMMAKLR